MASILRVSFDQIITVIEAKLVADGVVASPKLVKWVAGNEPPPHVAGQIDVLLRQGGESPNAAAHEGGGRYALRMEAWIDVFLRTQYAVDAAGTHKDWLTKHDQQRITLISSLDMYFPEDKDGNLYTNTAMLLRQCTAPERERHDKSWGDSVGTLEIHYLPNITLPGNA